jgi:hypothetical protein
MKERTGNAQYIVDISINHPHLLNAVVTADKRTPIEQTKLINALNIIYTQGYVDNILSLPTTWTQFLPTKY